MEVPCCWLIGFSWRLHLGRVPLILSTRPNGMYLSNAQWILLLEFIWNVLFVILKKNAPRQNLPRRDRARLQLSFRILVTWALSAKTQRWNCSKPRLMRTFRLFRRVLRFWNKSYEGLWYGAKASALRPPMPNSLHSAVTPHGTSSVTRSEES
jgi:hypothetical protein